MKRKLLIVLLAVCAGFSLLFGLSACENNTGSDSEHTGSEIGSDAPVGEKTSTKGLEYTLSADGTYYTVTGIGTATDKEIVIGDKWKDLPVTKINNSAFKNCRKLTSLTIGNSVTSMGEYAFYNCRSLTSVTIGSGVTSIGRSAFAHCDSLTSIVIPDSVTSIEDYAFYECGGLTSVATGNGVTSIGEHAFSDCSNLTSVTIGNDVASIGQYAFRYCYKLTSVYYSGTASDWEKIEMGADNSALINATRYYYSEV